MPDRLRLALQTLVPYWGERDDASVGVETLRLALSFVIGLTPLFYVVFQVTTPGAYDPLWVRLAGVAGAVLLMGGSYVDGPVQRYPRFVLAVVIHLLLGWYAFLAGVNDLATDYAVGYYFVVLAAAMVYSLVWTRTWPMASMLLASVALAVWACVLATPSAASVSPQTFLLVLVSGSAVVLFSFFGRRQAALELARSEAQMAEAERLAAIGSWSIHYPTGRRSWSEGAYRVLGVERTGPPPSLMDFVHPEDRAEIESLIGPFLASQTTSDRRFRVIRADGEVRVLRSIVQVVREANGEAVGLRGVFLDETAQVAHEAELELERDRARAAAAAKDTFLANMSHEIRTPLTAIIGYAQILGEEVSEESRDLVEPIATGGQRLLDTLNSVLDLARMEAGETDLVLVPADLGREAAAATRMLAGQAEAKGIALTVEVPETPVIVEADPAGLGRVLTNLLSNAVKFTDAGGVAVRVRQRGLEAVVDVTDTGRGMDEAFLAELFEPFRQASTGWGRSHEGTGLGMTIVRRLVEAMHGTITVESAPGEGTRFTVVLPVLSGARGDGSGGGPAEAPALSARAPAAA